jgi:RimJ/RimL family protein N-acetyltransferase
MSLVLAPLKKEHLPQLLEWRNRADIRLRCREYRLLTEWHQEQWWERIHSDPSILMFGLELDNHYLAGVGGLTSIHWVNRDAEISLYIGIDDIDDNYLYYDAAVELLCEEAFWELNLHRVWAEVYSFYEFGQMLFKVKGFRQEGVLRKRVWNPLEKEWSDSLIYALLAEEYRNE